MYMDIILDIHLRQRKLALWNAIIKLYEIQPSPMNAKVHAMIYKSITQKVDNVDVHRSN